MVAVTTSGQAVPRLVAVGDSASLDPACLLPLAIGVDDSDTPGDMLDALALAPFAAGTQPHASVRPRHADGRHAGEGAWPPDTAARRAGHREDHRAAHARPRVASLVLVAITTNEDLRLLHPAVVRPGRCLAHIEIGPLPPAQASGLLGRPVAGSVTLAELYGMRSGHVPPAPRTPAPGCTFRTHRDRVADGAHR